LAGVVVPLSGGRPIRSEEMCMRLYSVVEARDEYYALEMARAARKMVDDILEVRPGQRVVITSDSQTDERVARAAAHAVYAAGAFPIRIDYPLALTPLEELPEPIAAAVRAADIWIELTIGCTVYTKAWQAAVDAGVQYYGPNGMDADGFVRCVGRTDVRLIEEMGRRVENLLIGATLRVTSAAGTDITFTNEPTPLAAFRMRANPDKIPIMLAGQISWTPIEASMTGRLVADGVLSAPVEVGLIATPVVFEVEAGRIVSIEGGREATLLKNWIAERNDPTLHWIAHVSTGFNPGIGAPTGRILEDERAFGDIDFGWGAWVNRPAAGHFDLTCRQVTIEANGVLLEKEGIFVHPELAEICRAMGVPRH